jgi:hypothetical protein
MRTGKYIECLKYKKIFFDNSFYYNLHRLKFTSMYICIELFHPVFY